MKQIFCSTPPLYNARVRVEQFLILFLVAFSVVQQGKKTRCTTVFLATRSEMEYCFALVFFQTENLFQNSTSVTDGRNDTVQWHELRVQLPGEEDVGGAVGMEGEAKKLGVVQLVFEVYTRTWACVQPPVRPRAPSEEGKPGCGRPQRVRSMRKEGHWTLQRSAARPGGREGQTGRPVDVGNLRTRRRVQGAAGFAGAAERSNDATLQARHGGVQHGHRHAREPVQAGRQGAPAVQNVQLLSLIHI